MFEEKKSAKQNIIIQTVIFHVFFCPKKTAARAIQPRPLEILGTKEDNLMLKKQPAKELYNAVIDQPIILVMEGFIPLETSTSLSDPVILR